MLLRSGSEGDFEVFVFWVRGYVFDFCFFYIVSEGFFYIPDTVGNILRVSLSEHFYSTIGCITYKAGEFVTVCYAESGEAKADTLDPACKNYLLCYLAHFGVYGNIKHFLMQEVMF